MVRVPPSGHLSLPSLASGGTSEEGTPCKTLLEYPCPVFGKQREFLVLLQRNSGASFSQTVVSLSALSGKAKVSQGSEFYGGAVGESENFYSTGIIVFLIGS